MNSQWQTFLASQGARFDASRAAVTDFGNADAALDAVNSGHSLMDLSSLGIIAVHGDDARAFLQSQLTNDIKAVAPTRAQLSGYCTAKGRLLALFHVHERDGVFCLLLPAELVESTLKRLRMFVLRSKVVLEDRSDAVARVGFAGPQAEAQLAAATGSAPAAVNEVAVAEGIVIMRCAGPTPRFMLVGAPESLQSVWTKLATSATPTGTDAWWWLEIQAGLPQVFKASQEEFVPQMVNLEAVGGVSFQKGCYPGQEIVARMQYLGTLKRRMVLAHIATNDPPAPATPLYEGGAEATQSVGNIVYATRAPGGGCDALAVLVIAAAERGDIHVASHSGPALALREPPYPVN
jgi:hypothetical protein